jgi:hypothetical protein
VAKITYNAPSEGSAAAWVGDALVQRDRVLVTGGLLDAAEFPQVAAQGDRRYVEAGTLVGRTYAEEEAGEGFGPYTAGDPSATPAVPADDQAYLLLHDVYDADDDNSATFYRPGSLVYTRHLPAAMRTADALAAIREHYPTQRGEE